jgi:hypothetical protein
MVCLKYGRNGKRKESRPYEGVTKNGLSNKAGAQSAGKWKICGEHPEKWFYAGRFNIKNKVMDK